MASRPREKMSRQDRAKQFAPFDALKGLREALYLKEYERNKIAKGEVQPETAEKISKILFNMEKGDTLSVTYYFDGYYHTITGTAKLNIENQVLKVTGKNIPMEDIVDVDKIS